MDNCLLLLDIKGVLCQESKEKPQTSYVKLHNYIVLRPGLTEFLKFCYDHYTVGFFTSTTKKNAKAILERILTPEQLKNTHLTWTRSRTRHEPTESNGYGTVKVLRDLYENPKYNQHRKWTESNVLLIDDTASKIRFNKDKNVILVKPYDLSEDDKILYELMEAIPHKFKLMAN